MNEKKSATQIKGALLLLFTAFIWGISFVSQSVGMESVDAFTFIGIRTLLGAVTLLPVILISDLVKFHKIKFDVKALKYGVIIGVILCIATNLQQFAFYYSTAGKIAFITASYMFFIPIVGIFLKKKIHIITWLCVLLAFVGLYFLCFPSIKTAISTGEFSMNKGDFLTLICAVFFTAQILLIEKFGQSCDGIKMSFVQFLTAGLISFVLMWIFETPKWSSIKEAGIPILYAGILSCGMGYTLQIIGQKYCEATLASLLMSMESVFAVLASAILIHERLTGREIAGCSIMFSAILISQISDMIIARKKSRISDYNAQ